MQHAMTQRFADLVQLALYDRLRNWSPRPILIFNGKFVSIEATNLMSHIHKYVYSLYQSLYQTGSPLIYATFIGQVVLTTRVFWTGLPNSEKKLFYCVCLYSTGGKDTVFATIVIFYSYH